MGEDLAEGDGVVPAEVLQVVALDDLAVAGEEPPQLLHVEEELGELSSSSPPSSSS